METTLDVDESIINEHYRILNLPYGSMLINRHDPCLPINLQENMQEIEGLCQFARGNVLDVGANVGSHSMNFARVADMVYAFEPHPHTFYNLCANILLNSAMNVQPFNFALGSDTDVLEGNGSTTVWNIDPHQKNSAMGMEVGIGSLPVPIRTIDSLDISPLHFIKIDTEGHEYEILKGAAITLIRENVIVYVEIHSEALRESIVPFMTASGFLGTEYVHTHYIEQDAEMCTYGYLFWKEGRIVWGEDQPSSLE